MTPTRLVSIRQHRLFLNWRARVQQSPRPGDRPVVSRGLRRGPVRHRHSLSRRGADQAARRMDRGTSQQFRHRLLGVGGPILVNQSVPKLPRPQREIGWDILNDVGHPVLCMEHRDRLMVACTSELAGKSLEQIASEAWASQLESGAPRRTPASKQARHNKAFLDLGQTRRAVHAASGGDRRSTGSPNRLR